MWSILPTLINSKSWQKPATGVVIGPGLSTDSTSLAVFNFTLAHIAEEELPLIIDGSAIDLIAQHDLQVPTPTIYTPHRWNGNALSGIKLRTSRWGEIKPC